MQWLNAALAFSITMLILSMVVSTLVETLHRLLRLRANGLETMLKQLFNEVMVPHLGSAATDLAAARDHFVEEMMRNRAEPQTWVARLLQSQRLQKIDMQQFMTRLGASHYGDALRGAMHRVGGELADSVLHDVAHQFEAFGHEASEHFQRRARLSSVLVALVLAWCANINPYELLKTYLSDEQATERVIALQKAVEARYLKQTTPPAESPADTADASKPTPSAQEALQAANKEIEQLRDLGVPIGWTETRLQDVGFKYFCLFKVAVPTEISVRSLTTMFWLLVGGVLIGLGGPFWFDAVRSLSSVRNVAGAKPDGDDSTVAATITPTTSAVAMFKTAATGRDARIGQGAFAGEDDEPALG